MPSPLPVVLLSLLTSHTSPGRSIWSVEPADCAPALEVCEGARRSSFYAGAWVRQESEARALDRYREALEALDRATSRLLCEDDAGKIADCKPLIRSTDKSGRRVWTRLGLETLAVAVAVQESGFREDVEVGRGRAKAPSDDGGRGRGPGGEVCLIQAHPAQLWRHLEESELRARAANDPAAREALALTLLGSDPAALERCWTVGLLMLDHSRRYCAWSAPRVDWDWSTVSYYGTGSSCDAVNLGKTLARVHLFRKLYGEAKAQRSRG